MRRGPILLNDRRILAICRARAEPLSPRSFFNPARDPEKLIQNEVWGATGWKC
jgi:hypothetical protein